MKTITAALCLLICVCFAGPASAQDSLPQPGQAIDKNNIESYKNLFPGFWLDAFYTGYDGFFTPLFHYH